MKITANSLEARYYTPYLNGVRITNAIEANEEEGYVITRGINPVNERSIRADDDGRLHIVPIWKTTGKVQLIMSSQRLDSIKDTLNQFEHSTGPEHRDRSAYALAFAARELIHQAQMIQDVRREKEEA